jgi:tetracycline resistance efflux pump
MEEFGFLSLVPAIVTIIVALSTRKVAIALLLGVLAGALVFVDYAFVDFLKASWHYLKRAFTDEERIKIVLFIILIGGLIQLIASVGAYEVFANYLSKELDNARKSRLVTWFLSLSLFFDDYANVLISGASMRQINLKNKVSPALLAYMVDVIATVASVMLISTWASFEGATMVDAGKSVGIEKNMTEFFLASLPYHLYTYLAIFLTFVVAFSGKWFGYKLDTIKYTLSEKNNELLKGKVRPYHVFVPFIALILFAIIGLFASGYYILSTNGEEITLINILGSAPSIDVLILGTVFSILLALVLMLKDKAIKPKKILPESWKGFKSMFEVSLVIIFATGLSFVSDDLATGAYISGIITPYISPEVLPALIFIMSMLITVATGFSWSSMAIVMPVAYSLALANGVADSIPILSAAVISGAISGEHIIPYSEKCVMTSAACKLKPVYHIKTQILQVILVFVSATIGFYLLGLGLSVLLVFPITMGFIFLVHWLFARDGKIQLSD